MGNALVEQLLAQEVKELLVEDVPQAHVFQIEFVRNLTPADEAASALALPSQASAAVRLRGAHHGLARLLAGGMRDYEASYATGYSAGYIGQLRKDPAFAELVSHYQDQAVAEYIDAHKQLATLGQTALEILQERIETDSDKIGLKTLTDIAAMALDRSVAPSKSSANSPRGPAGSGISVNVSFVSPGAKDKTIEGTVNPTVTIDHEATK